MQQQQPAYYRARIAVMRSLIAEGSSAEVPLLRNGVFPAALDQQSLIAQRLREETFPTHALSFTELCTFNTFFNIHPEKVCGTEVVTTSREFPLTIKGSRQIIEQTIRAVTGARSPDQTDDIELQALALEIELQLMSL